jgi:hypothetical protein
MVIIMVLVIAWGVILAPGIIRKIRASNSERSISSFHHSLDLLESAAPRVVLPAYRLSGEDTGRLDVPVLVPLTPTTSIKPHPHLVLLRPDGQGGVATMNERYDYEERDDHGYVDPAHDAYFDDYAADYASYDDYDRADERYDHSYPADPFARREAALRRRNILFGLLGALVVTALGGFVLSMLWYLAVACGLLLVGYVGLMAWAATRGSITLGGSSSARDSQRHVARAVIPPYESPADGRWSDDYGAYDGREAALVDGADDGWWAQPRRVAAR